MCERVCLYLYTACENTADCKYNHSKLKLNTTDRLYFRSNIRSTTMIPFVILGIIAAIAIPCALHITFSTNTTYILVWVCIVFLDEGRGK